MGVPATVRPIIPLLPYQQQDVESTARFNWSNWSRQIGKSFSKSLRRILRGLERRRTQIFLSASETQSRELMMKARQHCEALKIASDFSDSKFFEGTSFRQLELTLPNRVRIIGLPANPRTARGFTGDALLDEFAMHQDDRAIWAALFPSVLRGDGELDIASTPKGRNNMFYRLSDNDQFRRTTVTILDAIAAGLNADAEQLRVAMGDEELWRQELLCEFVDEATAFLTYELIAGVEDPRIPLPIAVAGEDADGWARVDDALLGVEDWGECYLGVDVGRKRDLTVLWVWSKESGDLRTRCVLELSRVRFARQWSLLHRILDARNVRGASVDASGLGMQIAEQAADRYGTHRIDQVTFTQDAKTKLAGQLRTRCEDRSIVIPASQAVRNDWHSIERSVTTGGTIRFRAERSPDGHADRFWAAALGIDAAGAPGQPWRGEVFGAGARGITARGGGATEHRGDAGATGDDASLWEWERSPYGGRRRRRMKLAGV
jgi:phage FluMu gp28-like protein